MPGMVSGTVARCVAVGFGTQRGMVGSTVTAPADTCIEPAGIPLEQSLTTSDHQVCLLRETAPLC